LSVFILLSVGVKRSIEVGSQSRLSKSSNRGWPRITLVGRSSKVGRSSNRHDAARKLVSVTMSAESQFE
jgi:hypothetical protein